MGTWRARCEFAANPAGHIASSCCFLTGRKGKVILVLHTRDLPLDKVEWPS